MKQSISQGVVHRVPKDMQDILLGIPKIYALWEDLTPLARNEWICWIVSAKKGETRERRITVMQDKLLQGDRRPCCWAGCIHR